MEDVQTDEASNHQHGLQTNSQESTISAAASNLPALLKSSSDLSTLTMETDTTSPTSLTAATHIAPPQPLRVNSWDILVAESSSDEITSTDGSIISVENTGLNKSSKRTASGAVKLQHTMTTNLQPVQTMSSKKDMSASELSAQLKTRLKYAMLKVQNGWESQSIEQIETLSTNQHAPNSPASKISRRLSTSSDGYLVSPIGQSSPSRQHSRLFQSQIRGSNTPAATALMAVAGTSSLQPPSLAPAPPIISPRRVKRGSHNGGAPPLLSKPSLKQRNSGARVPQTPTRALPESSQNILQNQAEKDAVDSLLFMSSPNNSKNVKYSQEPKSASRAKKVDFEIPTKKQS